MSHIKHGVKNILKARISSHLLSGWRVLWNMLNYHESWTRFNFALKSIAYMTHNAENRYGQLGIFHIFIMFSEWLRSFNKVPHNYSEWKKTIQNEKKNENADVTSVVGTEAVQLVSWAFFLSSQVSKQNVEALLKNNILQVLPCGFLPFIWNRSADSLCCVPLKKCRWMDNENITILIFEKNILSSTICMFWVSSQPPAYFSCSMLHTSCLRMLCALLATAFSLYHFYGFQ